MNPLPPLPFVEDTKEGLVILIDNSQIEALQACPRLWEYQYLRRRTLSSNKGGRNFGSAIHEALALRYRLAGSNDPNEVVRASMNDRIVAYFAEHPAPDFDHRTADFALECLAAYNARYRNEPFHILKKQKWVAIKNAGVGQEQHLTPGRKIRWMPVGGHLLEDNLQTQIGGMQFRTANGGCPFIEQIKEYMDDPEPVVESSFIVPLGRVQDITVKYMGRVDLFVRDNDGDWVFDHKTAFQFGKNFEKEMFRDTGQRGYCYAFRELMGRKPRGFITDAIRVRRPNKRESYDDIVVNFDPDTDFKRIPFDISDEDLDEFRTDALRWVSTLLWHYDSGHFPMVSGKKQCVGKYGACEYYDICTLAKDARLSDAGLYSAMFEDNLWTPLTSATKTNESKTT